MKHRALKYRNAIVLSGAAMLVCAASAFTYFALHTKYYACLRFPLFHRAEDALLCGNYHFHVYGPAGYDVRAAEYYFGRAVTIDPHIHDAWHQYARTAFLRGDFSAAMLRINRQFTERGDELMASYYIRGLIEGYAKDYPSAEKDFKTFLGWDPNNWAANNDLAWIYFTEGKFKEAEIQTAKGLLMNENNPWLHMTHAMSRFNQGETDGVAGELQTALSEAKQLTPADWSKAYPGNDPAVAGDGLAEFVHVIERNLILIHSAKAGE